MSISSKYYSNKVLNVVKKGLNNLQGAGGVNLTDPSFKKVSCPIDIDTL